MNSSLHPAFWLWQPRRSVWTSAEPLRKSWMRILYTIPTGLRIGSTITKPIRIPAISTFKAWRPMRSAMSWAWSIRVWSMRPCSTWSVTRSTHAHWKRMTWRGFGPSIRAPVMRPRTDRLPAGLRMVIHRDLVSPEHWYTLSMRQHHTTLSTPIPMPMVIFLYPGWYPARIMWLLNRLTGMWVDMVYGQLISVPMSMRLPIILIFRRSISAVPMKAMTRPLM